MDVKAARMMKRGNEASPIGAGLATRGDETPAFARESNQSSVVTALSDRTREISNRGLPPVRSFGRSGLQFFAVQAAFPRHDSIVNTLINRDGRLRLLQVIQG
jgi:hypothetical protein